MIKKMLMLVLLTSILACNPTKKVVEKAPPVKNIQKKVNTALMVPDDPNVKKGVLSNGMTYYIRNNGKPAEKVELRLVVNAGSILEDDDQQGLAHFMEHMNFNGTKNFKKNELVDYLQSIGVKFGAHLNAYTGFDQTVYILPIPTDNPEKLEKGFQIIEDWAFNALLTEDEINKERGVVLEELRTRLGAENRLMEKYLPKVVYHSKYSERLPIGKKEILENFTPDKIKRFYNDWYRPSLMAVIAVGDVDVDMLEAKIKSHFGSHPARKNPRKREIFGMENHKETFVAIESDDETTFTTLRMMYKDDHPTQADKSLKGAHKEVIENLFSQMINNRLAELKNGDNPPFVYGYTFYGGSWVKNWNAFQSFAMAAGDPFDALKALVRENERVKRFGFQKGEFERAKMDVLARLESQYNDRTKQESKKLVQPLIDNFLNGETMPGIEWTFDYFKKELPKIKVEEVNDLIKSYLKDENRVVIITGKDVKTKEGDVLELLEAVKTDQSIKPYEDKMVQSSLFKTLPKKGSITKTEDFGHGITRYILSNGARVYAKKTDFKNDEILFACESKGGKSLLSDAEYEKVSLAMRGITEAGVAGLNKNDLNKFMTGKIANVRPYVSRLTENMKGSSTPKDIETLFQLIHLNFTDINKDSGAFKSYITKRKGLMSNVLGNPIYYFMDKFGRYRYNDNPRYSGFPTPSDYDKQDYDLAYKLFKDRFSNGGDFDFYFVGNFDENQLKSLIEQYIASLPDNGKRDNFVDKRPMPVTGDHIQIFKKGSEPKSMVKIVYYGKKDCDPKDALSVKAIGDILRIKLIEKLREKESGIYSTRVRSNLDEKTKDYNLEISYGCAPKNVEKLNKISLEEVERMATEGPTEKDLHKVKEAFLLERKEALKQNKFWLNQVSDAVFMGEDLSDIDQYDAKVNNLTIDQLKTVAKKYFTHGAVIGILKPEKEVK